ncbi:hypothetical protein Tco_1163167 [Tanacetum coccineum]
MNGSRLFRGTRDTETADASKDFQRKLIEQIECTQDNNSTSLELYHDPMYYEFREAFHRLFDANEGLFRSVLSRNMQNLEKQFSKETLHEKDSNSELRAIKGQFEHFMHSKMLSERQLQIQQCKVQEVQSSVTSSGDETSSRIVSDEEIEKKKLKHH